MSAEYLDHPRPLAFAHRGGAARQPENSLLAFENAARLGYAYLETDARSTADGKLIAFHDADLNRALGFLGCAGVGDLGPQHITVPAAWCSKNVV